MWQSYFYSKKNLNKYNTKLEIYIDFEDKKNTFIPNKKYIKSDL